MTAGRRPPAASPQPFPWDEVLRFAFGVLRWSPAVTWAATPREIAAALSAFPAAPPPMTAHDLAGLAAAYPDTPTARSSPHG